MEKVSTSEKDIAVPLKALMQAQGLRARRPRSPVSRSNKAV